MTAAGQVQERPDATQPGAGGDGTTARRTVFDDLADRAARVPWCWPVLLTLVLGFYQIGRPELWRDELSSWSFATRPLSNLFTTVRHTDATQLAYYLLLHFWIEAFGDSADAMRTLSVLAMAGAAACVTLAGRRLAGPRAGLLAGLVFALLPSVSRFAQEIRSYALQVLVGTLATLLLLRVLDRPAVRRWAAYAACLAVLGYVDLVALALVAGHAVMVALRWWRDRDTDLFWFGPAAVAGLAACAPLALVSSAQAGGQVGWILRPGLDLTVFTFFARNLFYSTSVAAVVILLAVFAWVADRRAAAYATALAVVPVAVVWLVSQGPHAYFFPRYLLVTVGAWAMLAGIALARLDVRVAAAVVLVIAIFAAGDQQVIRTPGAHNWAYYPVGTGVSYPDYAGVAAIIAPQARPGDGIVYPSSGSQWLMIGLGVNYYLERDLRHGVPMPRELFLAGTVAQYDHLLPVFCKQPAACIGHAPRIWDIVSGHSTDPFHSLSPAQAAALQYNYRLIFGRRVEGLTVYLLTRT